MTEESGFVKAILANPADDVTRLVYADWLDEQQTDEATRKANFLREQQFVRTSAAEAKGLKKHRLRLRRLAEGLHAGWLAAVSHLEVENCRSGTGELLSLLLRRRPLPVQEAFAFECPKEWSAMKPTEDEGVRFCDDCKQNVYFCESIADARGHAWEGHCVAVNVAVERKPGDLQHPLTMMTAGIISPSYFDREAEEDERK